jgi:predicted phosphodiesterase
MRTLIFSDTHLTPHFDQAKFNALKKIITSADRVIINGDFFDGYLTSFDRFCDSRWGKLFPLLKSKHAIYVYGNHDKKEFLNNKTKLFCVKVVKKIHISSGKKKFIVMHGQLIAPTLEMRYPHLFANYPAMLFNEFINKTGISLIGRRLIAIHNSADQAKLKSWARTNLEKNEYLVVGHTHLQEFDHAARFICAGTITHHMLQYLIIDSGHIKLINQKY